MRWMKIVLKMFTAQNWTEKADERIQQLNDVCNVYKVNPDTWSINVYCEVLSEWTLWQSF